MICNCNLKATGDLMNSKDYKERFIGEYIQTKIRYEKLKNFVTKIEAGLLCGNNDIIPKHDCPLSLLREQQSIMGQYLHILEERAVLEKIDLVTAIEQYEAMVD